MNIHFDMFKKLKDKLAEEVKSSPQRIQQFAQAAQAAVTSASGSISDITNNDLFSIGDNENSASSAPRPSPQKPNLFQDVSLSESQAEVADHSHETDHSRQRRLSNSSFASDISFRLPSYDTPSTYHLQSDFEVSASEADDRGFSGGPATLDRVTKEQLYSAYKRTQERYTKYRNQYGDLARHYKLLERENAKARSVLGETQDKALRRISELKEQCALEQSAKAHLEKALRIEIDEKNMKIETLNTKVNLLHTSNSENVDKVENKTDAPLINLATDTNNQSVEAPPLSPDITALTNKIDKMEQLMTKYKESLKVVKDKNSQMTTEIQILSNEIENKNRQIQELESKDELLTKANKKIHELNEANEELQNRINTFEFSKTKELSTLEIDLQKANEENTELLKKIEVFTKREEENAISLAENKLSIHKELEGKEAEIKSLKDALSACKQEVQSLKIVVEDYKNNILSLEEDKTKLSKDCTEITSARVKIDEINSQLQELTKKCQSLEQIKSKADEEHKCLQLQLKQETAEKLAMIDRNMYLESRNSQLSEENTKKSSQITNLESEVAALSNDKVNTAFKDEYEITNLVNELNLWKAKCEKLESEIQEEREELVKLQTEIEKLLSNHESIQAQNKEFRANIASLTSSNSKLQKESNQIKTKMTHALMYILQETNKLRKGITLASNETLSLLNANKEAFSSFAGSVNDIIHKSTETEQKYLDISAQNSKILLDYEAVKKDLSESQAKILQMATENMSLEQKIIDMNTRNIQDESVLKDKFTNDYQQALSDFESSKKEIVKLVNKMELIEVEKEKFKTSLLSCESSKKELTDEIHTLEDQLKVLNIDHTTLTKRYDELVNSAQSTSEMVKKLNSDIEQDSKAYQDIQKILELEKSEHSIKTDQLSQLNMENNKLKEKISLAEIKNKELLGEQKNLNEKLIELQELLMKSNENAINKEHIEIENKNLNDAIKIAEENNSKLKSEIDILKQRDVHAEENIAKLKYEVTNKSEDLERKLVQMNDLEAKMLLLSEENINLKSAAATFNLNIEKLETEINYIKKSHNEIEIEKDRLNDIIEKLESRESLLNNTMTVSHDTQTDKETDNPDSNITNSIDNSSMFENKWVLENKETAMVNTASLNLQTNAQEDIIEEYTSLKINFDTLKDENRRLQSDIEGLQSYLSKISKENSVLNDKLREVIASSEHSMDNDQSTNIYELKSQLQAGKEKLNDLIRENSLLVEENLELKDQINSQSYTKPLDVSKNVNNNQNEDVKEKYNSLLQTSNDLNNRNMELEQINSTVSGNIVQLQDKNEKLKRSNEKLERRLDEALVSLRHLHSLSENTELEYLRNILYEYLTGTGAHSVTLAKVLAAIVKFDEMQTQMVLQKEKERQGFLRQLGII